MPSEKRNKLLIFAVIFILVLGLYSCGSFEVDVHIFSDIEECQTIQSFKSADAEVEVYTSSEKDKYLKDLQYQEFFACEYRSDELTFELFAYEFKSADEAMSYFQNATGKGDNPNPAFSNNSGMGRYESVVVSENKAYSARCKTVQEDKMTEFLSSCFTIEIACNTED